MKFVSVLNFSFKQLFTINNMRIIFFLVITIAASVLVSSCKETEGTGSEKFRTTTIYTAKPSKVEEAKYEKDTLLFKEVMEFGENGKELKNTFYLYDGSVSNIDIYEYDENGNKIGSKYYDNADSLMSYNVFEYDSLNRQVSSIKYDAASKEIIQIVKYGYDSLGNKAIHTYIDKYDFVNTIYRYSYDENKNETSVKVYSPNNDLISQQNYRYLMFNDRNQWTRREGYGNDGVVNGIWERTYKYYRN